MELSKKAISIIAAFAGLAFVGALFYNAIVTTPFLQNVVPVFKW